MFNRHLLKLDLSVAQYMALGGRSGRRAEAYYAALPAYVIARCPLCDAANIEKLDTYTLREWPGMNILNGASIFGHQAVVHHCEHFALVQRFLNLRGAQPEEISGILKGPEVPHVIGYLLKPGPFPVPHTIDPILRAGDFYCHATIHALPVCRVVNHHFEPAYTVFIVAYFSENPAHTREVVRAFNAFFRDPRNPPMFWEPPDGHEMWWDLRQWVAAGKLYWLDAATPDLKLRTRPSAEFPYGDIPGRRYPYFTYLHRLDAWKNPPTLHEDRPAISRFGRHLDEDGKDIRAGVAIRWEGLKDTEAFRLTRHPVAQYWLPEPETAQRVRSVNILIHDIKAFAVRPDVESGKTEVLLQVDYAPGERTLGLTTQHAEARRWVDDANRFLEAVKALRYSDFLRLLSIEG